MSFARPLEKYKYRKHGLEYLRVSIPLLVYGASGSARVKDFRFDTGADLTMVSHDVASLLGLPAGGPELFVEGTAGRVGGRLVEVRFSFPDSDNPPAPKVARSRWVVLPEGKVEEVAILGFLEVHDRFRVEMSRFKIHFHDWT